MVRLKQSVAARMRAATLYFNPTMVRLKLELGAVAWLKNNRFQSHNGSIKTILGG